MMDTKDLGWFFWIPFLISIVGLGFGLSLLEVQVTTVLWFIFSALLLIGGAIVRSIAFGFDSVLERLDKIPNQSN